MGMDLLKGLATTLRELGKKPTTVSYPEEKRELPARYRGRHVLHRRHSRRVDRLPDP